MTIPFVRAGSLACLAFLASLGSTQVDQFSLWKRVPLENPTEIGKHLQFVQTFLSYRADFSGIKAVFDAAPYSATGSVNSNYVVHIPGPDGQMHSFFAVEKPIMTAELARTCSSKVYRLKGIDDPYAVGIMDTGVNGFHGYVQTPQGDYMIDPVSRGDVNNYAVYYRRANWVPKGMFSCTTVGQARSYSTFRALGAEFGGNLKTTRLAMNATVEYTAVFGSETAAKAAVVTSVNRVAGVYEKDCAITYTLVRNNPYVTEPDGFTNNNGGAMLGENQANCDTNVGDANYDMGHVFSTGGGGVAGLGVAGITGSKAMGVTGSPDPQGDAFDIDYVAHEMGHQWGGYHTFNGTSGACGFARTDVAAYEVGSGTTIMAYAGICAGEDVQPHSDAYFHVKSLDQIWAHRNNTPSSGSDTPNGNIVPTAAAGSDQVIPMNTPFRLTGSGTDGNGDTLTYCWEQYDLGTATSTPSDISTGPLVRSLNPTASKMRFVPKLATVLAGTTDVWEKLPNVARSMVWRLTVRDNRAGGGAIQTDSMTISVAGSQFKLNSPNGGQDFAGNSSVPVTWTVGGSAGTAKVNILLSKNGGNDYGTPSMITLASGVNNTGTANVTMPNIDATNCRLFVEGTGNIFYDVSDAAFKIHKVITGPVTLLSLGLAPNVIVGGTPVLGSVFLSRLADAPTTVTLSDNSGSVATPAGVTVAQGAESALFNLTTSPVTGTVNVKVTGSLNGTTQFAMLQVNPAPDIASLTLDRTTLYGGQSTDGTVTLAAPAPGYATVYFTSDRTTVIPDPKVYIANGATTSRFHVDTTAIVSDTWCTIRAKVGTKTKAVFLLMKKMPTLASLTVAPTSVRGGTAATGTATLTAKSIGTLAVLTSADSVRVIVPTQVNVTDNNTSANFNITTYSVTSNTIVTITGTFNGTVRTATLTLTP